MATKKRKTKKKAYKKGLMGQRQRLKDVLDTLDPKSDEYEEYLEKLKTIDNLIDMERRDGMITAIEWAKVLTPIGIAFGAYYLDSNGFIPGKSFMHRLIPKFGNSSDLKRRDVFRDDKK